MPLICYARRPLARRHTPARLSSLAGDEFEGYASLFGVADSGGDIVMPGAFARSLRRRPPDQVRMLYQHAASEPLGVWEAIREPLAVGDAFTLTPGCDKQFASCKRKFSNSLNFRGAPYMPGTGVALAVASSSTPLDGGSRYGN